MNRLKVRVSKNAPTDKPKLGKMKYFGGRTSKKVDPNTTIKIRPKKGVPGRTVVVYKPVKKGVLTLSDVKVYVKPIKTPEENGEVDTSDKEIASSSGKNPENASDGNPDTCFVSDEQNHPFWIIDLGKEFDVSGINVQACSESRECPCNPFTFK